MIELLESETLKPFREVGHRARVLTGSATYVVKLSIDSDEAESYFKWLCQVAAGALHPSGLDVKEVYDQLFTFIYVMGDAVHVDEALPLFNTPKFENALIEVGRRLSNLENEC